MNAQHLSDYYESIVIIRDINYANTKQGLEVTKKFIKKNNLILFGGMAIDMALKAKGHDGIYSNNKLPDYDFISPNSIMHATAIGKMLCKLGLPNISIIYGKHVTTMRVRVNYFAVADIGYCPPNVFDILPYIECDGFRIIHPHFQMMDIHHALSFPFEDPSMPVVNNRWQRDMKRYNKLFDAYPITSTVKLPKFNEIVIPKKLLNGSCITGWAALSFWRDKKLTVPDGEYIHILDDDFSKWVEASSTKPTYMSSLFGKLPRSVIVTIDDVVYEVFDNLGEKVSAEKFGNMYVANLQHVMMLFIAKKYLQPMAKTKYYDAAYVEATNIVQKKDAPPGAIPSLSVYGRCVWSDSYIINRRRFAAKLSDIKLVIEDTPKNKYPVLPYCESNITFDYASSPYFDISGNQTQPFMPKRVEYFGVTDIVTAADN